VRLMMSSSAPPAMPDRACTRVMALTSFRRWVIVAGIPVLVDLAKVNIFNMFRLCACGFLPAQRQEVLRPFDGLTDFAKQLLQVFVAVDEINLRCIDDQKIR
jgi:hypothetical protein